jgi:hypothetical protein
MERARGGVCVCLGISVDQRVQFTQKPLKDCNPLRLCRWCRLRQCQNPRPDRSRRPSVFEPICLGQCSAAVGVVRERRKNRIGRARMARRTWRNRISNRNHIPGLSSRVPQISCRERRRDATINSHTTATLSQGSMQGGAWLPHQLHAPSSAAQSYMGETPQERAAALPRRPLPLPQTFNSRRGSNGLGTPPRRALQRAVSGALGGKARKSQQGDSLGECEPVGRGSRPRARCSTPTPGAVQVTNDCVGVVRASPGQWARGDNMAWPLPRPAEGQRECTIQSIHAGLKGRKG